MEDLTKTQIILLCLLVSFVTSIGTGVITFSLLSEAPQTVSQTINRVVERTIEKVVPSVAENKTTTKEVTTVVVKEEDMVIDAIGKNTKSIVRIKSDGDQAFFGLGLILDKDGTVVADGLNFNPEKTYDAVLFDGKSFDLEVLDTKGNTGFVFFEIKKDDKAVFTPAVFGSSDSLQLGQSVIAVSGIDQMSIATGRVSTLKRAGDTATSTGTIISIETDVKLKDSAFGGPLLNLSGQIVGINTAKFNALQTGIFAPISLVQESISLIETK